MLHGCSGREGRAREAPGASVLPGAAARWEARCRGHSYPTSRGPGVVRREGNAHCHGQEEQDIDDIIGFIDVVVFIDVVDVTNVINIIDVIIIFTDGVIIVFADVAISIIIGVSIVVFIDVF